MESYDMARRQAAYKEQRRFNKAMNKLIFALAIVAIIVGAYVGW